MTVSAGSMRVETAAGDGQTAASIAPARRSLLRSTAAPAAISRAREARVPGRSLRNDAAAIP